jgi:hypothetical protein
MTTMPAIRLSPIHTYEEAGAYLSQYSDSYNRMEISLSTDDAHWLRLLGENWSVCGNICEFHDDLESTLPQHGPVVAMLPAKSIFPGSSFSVP